MVVVTYINFYSSKRYVINIYQTNNAWVGNDKVAKNHFILDFQVSMELPHQKADRKLLSKYMRGSHGQDR